MSDAALEALREQIRAEVHGELAHIVHPAEKMTELREGQRQRVKSLCGTFVKKEIPREAPVCRGCFDELMLRDNDDGGRTVEDVKTELV